jgi:hypothetical protein
MEAAMNKNKSVGQRKHSRQIISTPIMITDWDMTNYSNGMLRNSSAGGVNLELGNAISPGVGIFFQLRKQIESSITNFKKDMIVPAKIVWCMESGQQSGKNYSVGIKFIHPLHL